MATRIESKSRTPKRVQASVTWADADGFLTVVSGKAMRPNQRGFPGSYGADTTAMTYADVTP